MRGLIHYNPHLPHQVDHARAFQECGFGAVPTPTGDADIHVISGPHFAERFWRTHPRTLKIDRAWWGDPDCVSVGWLQPDGSRIFARGKKARPHPEPRPWKMREQSCALFADYGQDVTHLVTPCKQRFGYTRIRRHPADARPPMSLESTLALCHVAVGTSSTVLFNAVMAGLPTICLDPKSPLRPVCAHSLDAPLFRGDRTAWLHDMAYSQFTLEEIANGTAWSLLREVMPE